MASMEMSSVYSCTVMLDFLLADLWQLTKAQFVGGSGGMPPRKFWNFEPSESGSVAL